MVEPITDQVERKIGQAKELYHRLILIVAPAGSGKTRTLKDVNKRTGAHLVNVNLEISRRMLELTERQRVLRLSRVLGEIVDEVGGDTVLLDNIEILFEVSLKQDPLRLLQGLSRKRIIVVAWNGNLGKGHLTYAAPGHPEHQKYSADDLQGILTLCYERKSKE